MKKFIAILSAMTLASCSNTLDKGEAGLRKAETCLRAKSLQFNPTIRKVNGQPSIIIRPNNDGVTYIVKPMTGVFVDTSASSLWNIPITELQAQKPNLMPTVTNGKACLKEAGFYLG